MSQNACLSNSNVRYHHEDLANTAGQQTSSVAPSKDSYIMKSHLSTAASPNVLPLISTGSMFMTITEVDSLHVSNILAQCVAALNNSAS